jgi:integrase
MATKRRTRGTGSVRQLPSGKWQATFIGPDARRRPAPETFDSKLDARAWCDAQASDVELGLWHPDETKSRRRGLTLAIFGEDWLKTRELRPSTLSDYQRYWRTRIVPELGDVPLNRISPEMVRRWYAAQDPTKATIRANTYALLKAVMATAVDEGLVEANPCRVRRGSQKKRRHVISIATPEEIDMLAQSMPPSYELLIQIAAWCGPRSGEIRELRRKDIDLDRGVLHIRRAVTHVPPGRVIVGPTKSDAGERQVHVPPHLLPALKSHMMTQVPDAPEALLFPSRANPDRHLRHSALERMWVPARTKVGRPDLRFHDLRHVGATFAAMAGATLKETMSRIGHSTPHAALLYQHVAEGRDEQIAAALSRFARPAAASSD